MRYLAHTKRIAWLELLVLGIMLLACAPATSPPTASVSGDARPAEPARPQRTVVMAIRLEPNSLALRPPRETFANVDHNRLFNADIANLDDRAAPRPYLAETLPELNTESWQVFPDGRMRTTYRMRPNLTWHDGTPFSAEDFVFSHRVYSTPDVGLSRQPPFDAIEQAMAPDARTLVLEWKRPYPDASHLAGREQSFPALPRHLLAGQFAPDAVEGFVNHPFWTRDYLGLGPYREVHWEPGAFIEAAAFDGHATGRAKVDRIRIVFIGDRNTGLANVLTNEVHFAGPTVLGVEQAVVLDREWGRQGGVVINQFFLWRGVYFQFLPAFTSPRALTDVRVRKALAYTVDTAAVNEASNAGLAIDADYYLGPKSKWGAAVERGAVKYRLDPRLAEQLMREAGYEKGRDGIYAHPSEGRLTIELATTSGGSGEREVATLASDWQRAGFDITQRIIPAAQSLDVETRASYPGMFVTTNRATERTAVSPLPGNIPTPENNWRGGSQTSWTHPAYTDLVAQFTSTLLPEERAERLAQMARVFTEDVAGISLHFQPTPVAAVSALRGPNDGAPETNIWWNVDEWEMH
jgi:peptide/nickel transport system substrate-binding protein